MRLNSTFSENIYFKTFYINILLKANSTRKEEIYKCVHSWKGRKIFKTLVLENVWGAVRERQTNRQADRQRQRGVRELCSFFYSPETTVSLTGDSHTLNLNNGAWMKSTLDIFILVYNKLACKNRMESDPFFSL